ncbi:MAG: SusC/RagA family TonB-linked outer membrane protein, partial [Bacteroidaceae bacterium]
DSHAFALKNMLNADEGGLGYQVYNVPAGEDFIGTNGKINPNAKLGYNDGKYYYTPDDWYDEMFDKGNLRQEYNASISGSSDKLNFYMSLGYLDDSGIVEGSGFSRYTGRLKADYQAKSWLKVGANLGYTYYNSQAPDGQTKWGSSGNLFYITSLIAPIYPLYMRGTDGNIKKDKNGLTLYDFGNSTNQTRAFLAASNPAATLKLDKFETLTDVLSAKFYAIVDLYKGLQFTANIGINTSNERSSFLYNPFYGSAVSSDGQVEVAHYRNIGVNQQYLLTYKKTFAEKHGVDLLAGYEAYNLKLQELDVQSKKLYNPWVGEISNAIFDTPNATSYTDRYSTLGFLFRGQYDYDSKYFVSASYRRDASSRFHPDNRWGNFGSIGAAWLINKEEFFNVNWINQLKLKASYGIQGNDNLNYSDGTTNYYPYLDQFTIGSSNGQFAPTFKYKG